ncbi:hypothetical protein AY600_12955 [Phormidium willei BDU 130791]|nr:hypothetical protein AY600_12955 [Phormidium willei BDU 130791]
MIESIESIKLLKLQTLRVEPQIIWGSQNILINLFLESAIAFCSAESLVSRGFLRWIWVP